MSIGYTRQSQHSRESVSLMRKDRRGFFRDWTSAFQTQNVQAGLTTHDAHLTGMEVMGGRLAERVLMFVAVSALVACCCGR